MTAWAPEIVLLFFNLDLQFFSVFFGLPLKKLIPHSSNVQHLLHHPEKGYTQMTKGHIILQHHPEKNPKIRKLQMIIAQWFATWWPSGIRESRPELLPSAPRSH